MKLSRNALKNLSKRYKAILKKCCLLNGLGMLLVAGSCVCSALLVSPQEAVAETLYTTYRGNPPCLDEDLNIVIKNPTQDNKQGIFLGDTYEHYTYGKIDIHSIAPLMILTHLSLIEMTIKM